MTKVIAHRGSKGTHPENTLVAYQEAIDCQADGIEIDVQYTKDRQLVVIHDNTVDRTTNGHGEIDSLTLAEIQQLDAGSWFDESYKNQRVPSFLEVLDFLQKQNFKGLLNIEIKTDEKPYLGIEKDIAAMLQTQSWSFSYLYSSFNLKSLELIQELDPEPEKAYIIGTSEKKVKRARELTDIASIHPDLRWVMKARDKVKEYPKNIRPWTVNEEHQMQYCFRKKLAGIHTDYPREAIRYRKLMKPTLE